MSNGIITNPIEPQKTDWGQATVGIVGSVSTMLSNVFGGSGTTGGYIPPGATAPIPWIPIVVIGAGTLLVAGVVFKKKRNRKR